MFIGKHRAFSSLSAGFSAFRTCSKGGEDYREAEARRKIKPSNAESKSRRNPRAAIAHEGAEACGAAQRCADQRACDLATVISQFSQISSPAYRVEQHPPQFVASKGLRRGFEGSAGKVFEASANPREGSGATVDRAPDHAAADTRRQRGVSLGQLLRTWRRPRARRAGINQAHIADQQLADCASSPLAKSGRWPLSTMTSATSARAAPASTRCSLLASCWPRARAADPQQFLAVGVPASQQGPALWMKSGKGSAKTAEKNPAPNRKKNGSAEAARQCCAVRACGLKSFEQCPGIRGCDA